MKRKYIIGAAIVVVLAVVIPFSVIGTAQHKAETLIPLGGTAAPTGAYPNTIAFCRGIPATGLQGLVDNVQHHRTVVTLAALKVEVIFSPTSLIRSNMDTLYSDVLKGDYSSASAKSAVAMVNAQLGMCEGVI